MKRISKLLVLVVWSALIYILFKLNLLDGDMNNLNQFFENCGIYKKIIFISLSSLRVVALIPSAVFMILGGVIFSPTEGFILTLISVILSETIIFLVSKLLVGTGIQNHLEAKHPKLYDLLSKNNTKILSIGILCPIAPSDPTCFLASSTGLSFKRFIATIIIANMPMMILYSFLGNSFMSSANNTIIILTLIILISLYSIYLWNKEQKQENLV